MEGGGQTKTNTAEPRPECGAISVQSSGKWRLEGENHRCLQHCPKTPWLPRGGGGRRERPERPAQAVGCTRRGEMKWSSSAKPGLRHAVAGLAGSADQTRTEGGPTTARSEERRVGKECVKTGRS